jgi:hypothetical protein
MTNRHTLAEIGLAAVLLAAAVLALALGWNCTPVAPTDPQDAVPLATSTVPQDAPPMMTRTLGGQDAARWTATATPTVTSTASPTANALPTPRVVTPPARQVQMPEGH